MLLPWQLTFDPVTTDFTCVRWLGDRKGIEKVTKVSDRVVVDCTAQLESWRDYLRPILDRGVKIYAYANHHYAGLGPATVA